MYRCQWLIHTRYFKDGANQPPPDGFSPGPVVFSSPTLYLARYFQVSIFRHASLQTRQPNAYHVDALTTFSRSVLQMEEAAAGKARLPTMESLTAPVFMHQYFHRRCPQYIFDLVSFRTGTGRLRSATTIRATVTHRPRTNLGIRAFSIAGPSVWNSLPRSLRLIDDHEQFRKQLKTYYFNVAFR